MADDGNGADQTEWLTPQEQWSWRAYLRGSRLLEAALDRDLQSHGVQLSEYEIISMLSESPGRRMRMSTLADLVVQSRSRLTHTAIRLERRNWVRRESVVEDRRGVDLVLTDEGLAAIAAMAPLHVASVRKHLVDALPPGLLNQLGIAMDAVRHANADGPLMPEPNSKDGGRRPQ